MLRWLNNFTRVLVFSVIIVLMSSAVFGQNRRLSLDPKQSEWFKEARFGMFIHWGLYSMLEGSYNGRTLPDMSKDVSKSWYAEWIQMRLEVPAKEYQALAKSFNPVGFDADEWILEAKNAGMRYFVITAKHHDGFALWDTKVSDFKITNTPFGRDVLAELVASCKKHGIKYGFYYSHWQDWEYPGGAMPNWFPMVPDEDFERYWQTKSLPQVKELLDEFDPDLLWFDTWDWETHITDERRDELIALVRSNSDKCLINGRISYHSPGDDIDFLEMHDNRYPEKILDRPWQTPATMTYSWGWHAKDYNWKSSDVMIGYLVGNASKGGNYLLNVGPKPDGTFPAPAVRRLREMGAWLHVNGDIVYGTQPVKVDQLEGVYFTQKSENGKIYLYIGITKPMESVSIPVSFDMVNKCVVLESKMPVNFKAEGTGTAVELSDKMFKDSSVVVLVAEISKPI